MCDVLAARRALSRLRLCARERLSCEHVTGLLRDRDSLDGQEVLWFRFRLERDPWPGSNTAVDAPNCCTDAPVLGFGVQRSHNRGRNLRLAAKHFALAESLLGSRPRAV
jgi:hypothetical protein